MTVGAVGEGATEMVCPDCVKVLVRCRYRGELRPGQSDAADAILQHYLPGLVVEGGRPPHEILRRGFRAANLGNR
jgi:hypothetical protein